MKNPIRLFLSLALFLLSNLLFAQDCGCNQCQIPIQANYARDFYLDVAGAIFNDLGTPQQGVCEVEIDFAHDFLSDLTASLVSPSGQVVQLIRDVNPNDTTYFSRWKIKFKPCTDPVVPDPGRLAGFDDNTNWPISGSFSGQYYPATGCLEDFNTGGVNGRWTLKVQSQNLRGVGYIYGFKIKFCQQQGIACVGLTYDLVAGEDCSNAAEFPPNLSNYIGSTAGFIPSQVPDFCGEIDNDQWFKFVAKCPNIIIQMTPGACVWGAGIQIALYDECGGPAIDCHGGCSDCGWQSLTINASLVVGEEYYFLIDGWSGDLCDYEFTVPPGCLGGIGDPHISEVPTGCEGYVYQATLVNMPFGAAGYIWTASNGALVNGQAQVTIPGPGNTSVEVTLGNGVSDICVAAYNFTDTTQFFCQNIEADTNLFLVENAIICYDEGPFYSQYSPYGVPPLDFPGTHQYSLFDYPDEEGNPYPCPVTLGIHLTIEGGFSQLPAVVALGDSYVLPNGQIVYETGPAFWSDTLPSGCRLDHSQMVHLIGLAQHGDGCAPDTLAVEMPGTNVILQCPGGFPAVIGGGGPHQVLYQTSGAFDLIGKLPGQTFLFEDTVTFNFLPPTMANFSVVPTDPITVGFQNTSQNAISYLWNFGDGTTSTEFAPTHSYTASGTFTISLTATGLCGSKTITKTVQIQGPAPQTAFQALQQEGCAPFEVQFQDQSQGNPTSWSWTFPGGTPTSSTMQNPIVSYQNPGIYEVTLSATNGFGSNVLTQTNLITVHPVAIAAFEFTTLDLSIATTNESQNASGYSWDFGDGTSSTEFEPFHTYAAPGNYFVTLIALGLCGPDTSAQSLTVEAPATQAFFQALPGLGCVPLIVQFQDQSLGNPTSWNWNFPGGTPTSSTEQNPTVIYLNPGVFDASLTVENAFGNSSTSQTGLISTSPLPTVAFSMALNNLEVSMNNQSQNANSYSWDFGDGTGSTETNPIHLYATAGVYLVSLQAINNCGNSILEQWVTVQTSGISTPTAIAWLSVSPNPSNGHFQLEMRDEPSDALILRLFNALGQNVGQQDLGKFEGYCREQLNFEQLPSAIYWLEVRTEEKRSWVKLILE